MGSGKTIPGARPPYPEAEHRDVGYDGVELRAAMVRCLRDVRPTMIALPDPLDRHPDHHATGLDLVDARPKSPIAMPQLLTYLVHWPNWPPGWDARKPSAHTTPGPLQLPEALRKRGFPQTVLTLTDEEVAVKGGALAEYVTQQQEIASLLAAFVRRTEPFRLLTTAELRRIGAE